MTQDHRGSLSYLFISAQEQRLRSGWRLIGFGMIFLILLAFTAIPLAFVIPSLETLSSGEFLLINAVSLAIPVTIAVWAARIALDRRSFSSLGVSFSPRAIRDVLAGAGIAALMMGSIWLVEWAAGWLVIEGTAWQGPVEQDLASGLLLSLAAFILVGWGEELLFRGYILQNLSAGLNPVLGAVISSGLFAAGHLLNPSFSWLAFLGLFISGIFFAWIYFRSKTLWLPVGIHTGWNFFEGNVFGFPVSGEETTRLLLSKVDGPLLLTGGSFGPEAGLVLLVGLASGIGLVITYLSTRARKDGEH